MQGFLILKFPLTAMSLTAQTLWEQACFKAAKLCLVPFGKEIEYPTGRTVSKLANALWIIFIGIWLALAFVIEGIGFCVTIIGILFGLQYFKFAKLAFAPFGAEIKDK